MKIATVAITVLCAFMATSNAQIGQNAGIGVGVVGFPPSDFFLNILQIQALRLQTRPGGLPDDLNQRVDDTLLNAETAFNACNANTQATLPWLQIRCISVQLKISKSELKAIEDEAKAREAAASATTTSPAANSSSVA